jgi:hypothetical protein
MKQLTQPTEAYDGERFVRPTVLQTQFLWAMTDGASLGDGGLELTYTQHSNGDLHLFWRTSDLVPMAGTLSPIGRLDRIHEVSYAALAMDFIRPRGCITTGKLS